MSSDRHAEVLCLLERGCDSGFSDASDNHRLLALLHEDPDLLTLAKSVMHDACLTQALFSSESRTASLIIAQIRQQRPGQQISAARRVTKHLQNTRKSLRSQWWWGLSAAAAALLVVSTLVLRQHADHGVGSFTRADGTTVALVPEVQTTVTDAVVLGWPGESTAIRIAANATLTSHSGSAKHLTLTHGRVDAAVDRQPPGQPLRITTPNGEVEVIGTHFTLDVGDQGTVLSVSSGQVVFHSATNQGIPVASGDSAYAGADGAIVKLPPESITCDFASDPQRASWIGIPTATGLDGSPHPEGQTWRWVASPENGPLVRLNQRMRVQIDVTLTQACAVGILLLLKTPDGRFIENRQVTKTLPIGRHKLDLSLDEFEHRTPVFQDKPMAILVQRLFISSYAALDRQSLQVHRLTITTDP